MSTQGSLNVIQKEDIVNSQKFNYVLDKLSAAVIEVVTDKEDFQWMKKQIDEINITQELLEERPLVIQGNKEKEIENLSTSDNDTQACSQSLNTKIILASVNSQEFIKILQQNKVIMFL